MIAPTPDFFELFSIDHRQREAVAAAERLRRRRSPASVPPRTVTPPAAVHALRPATGSHCRHAA